jgi:Spy/CpxP family protein refolding chaperone
MHTFSLSLALGATLLTGLAGNSLIAQDQQPPAATTSQDAPSTTQPLHAPNPQRQAKRMTKKLALTPDQESKLEPILAERQQQIESTRSDTTLAPKDKRVRLRGIHQDSEAKIESILTDTQKQQYEQMKQNHKANERQTGGASPNS